MGKIITVLDAKRCIGCYSCMLACARVVHQDFAPYKSAIQVRTQGGLQGKLSINTCRGCREPLCAEACAEGALRPRDGGGVKLEKEKCIGCGRCARACTIGALAMLGTYPLVCQHCGVCAEFCPHQILALTEPAIQGRQYVQ